MNTKRVVLIALSGCLLMLGAAAFLLGRDSNLVHGIGAAAIVCSVFLLKGARRAVTTGRDTATATESGAQRRIGLALWLASLASVLVFAVSYLLLVRDAEHGYNDVVPVILFAAAALACAVTVGMLVAKLIKS
jgi:hypothetical protein